MRNRLQLATVILLAFLAVNPSHSQTTQVETPSNSHVCSQQDDEADKDKAIYLLKDGDKLQAQDIIVKASRLRIQSISVMTLLKIDRDGRILDGKLKESTGYPDLDRSLIRYAKTFEVSKGVCGVRSIPINFGFAK